MESTTIEAFMNLKEELARDPRVLLLNELEKRIQSDDEVAKLSKRKDEKADAYEHARTHFGENAELTKAAQKELFQAKLDLDSYGLCKAYNTAYAEVSSLYREMDDVLFGFLRTKKHCGGKL